MDGDMKKLFSGETCRWFEETLGRPTAVQREGWPVIHEGRNVLISAPTGTGKTLTAFLMMIDRLASLAREGRLEDRLYAVYVSPLKALGNDIRENLRRPIDGLNAPIRTAVRNGDTPPAEREKMKRRPPHILITTPESLYLLLSSEGGLRMLKTAETVVVDELHALLGSKRGVHLLLSLERLDQLCGNPLQRVGLSATIRPLERAADCLGPDTAIVAPAQEKEISLRVISPTGGRELLPGQSVWPDIYREIYEAALREDTVLVFCEGRATAEKVAHGLNGLGGEDFARTHHGSMSKERRLEAEQALREGRLKVLCATSSMELGIDVGDVSLVVQVGCPARVDSALQRMGRAGHRPGEVSRMVFYPRMNQEILLAAMTARGVREKAIEELEIPRMSMDVLAQHLVAMACAGEYTVDEALSMFRRCAPYRELEKSHVERLLGMLAGDDEHLADRPVSPRVEYDRIHGVVRGSEYSRMLALFSGGTIPDKGMFAVCLEDSGLRLGELDEEFVFEARLGDKFLLGASAWRITAIERDRVLVAAASADGAQSPFWRGDGMGRGYETGRRFGALLRGLEEACHAGRLEGEAKALTEDDGAARRVAGYIEEQIEANGCLATDVTLVAEYFQDDAGEHQMMLHCPYGARVNQGLAILLRAQAARGTRGDVRAWYDDDGVLLHVTGEPVPEGLLEGLNPATIEADLRRELPSTAQFTIAFRYNMYRALMMGIRSAGRMPLWQQRLRASEALARAADFPDHPILQETMRDCVERYIDARGLRTLLEDVRARRIHVVTRRQEGRPSPMTLSLRRQVEAEMMYEYAPTPRQTQGLAVGGEGEKSPSLPPDEEQLLRAHTGARPAESPQKLHEKLMIEGDMEAGETDAPLEWLEALAGEGRAAYVEPGLWIAAEEEALYDAALCGADDGVLKRVLRRCLRYRGPHRAGELADRYLIDPARAARLLRELAEEGAILLKEEFYVHAQVYQRAQRMTLSARRNAVRTAPPEAYAAFLARWQDGSGSPQERLSAFLKRVYGLYLPTEQWEGAILPAHTSGYQPKLLDGVIASGETVWRLSEDGNRLAFFPEEAVDWEAEIPAGSPDGAAQAVRALLLRRGASFTYAIAAALPGVPVRETLKAMALSGEAVCDSLSPLRKPVSASSARQRVRTKLAQTDGGRWELARPLKDEGLALRLDRAFDRWGILCRETAALEGIPFSEALALLRQMEYTGAARRGYFVRGLGGAQFVRARDFPIVESRLSSPGEDCVCLNAVDTAQAWGRILPLNRGAGEGFVCVPGTAVVLKGGKIALILERQGSSLRALEGDAQGCRAIAEAFRAGKIYPHLRHLTVREYPAGAAPWLEEAGFVREMRDYVLFKARPMGGW